MKLIRKLCGRTTGTNHALKQHTIIRRHSLSYNKLNFFEKFIDELINVFKSKLFFLMHSAMPKKREQT